MTDLTYYGMRWYGRTSAEQRKHCVQWYLEPAARLLFATVPEANALTLSVSMFWSDEANDATHLHVIANSERDPKWPKMVQSALYGGDTWEKNPVSIALYTITGGAFGDNNYSNIVAFGSQCEPECHQEMSTEEAYRPWAFVYRREGGEIETKIVGKTRQRDFEDNYNVGFSRIGEDADDYYEGAGRPLDEYSDSYIRNTYRCGEIAAQLDEKFAALGALIQRSPVGEQVNAIERMRAELTALAREATDAIALRDATDEEDE